MSWKFAAVRDIYGEWTVREVYFEEGETPHSFTESPIKPSGESFDELRQELRRMMADLDNGDIYTIAGAEGDRLEEL